MALHTNQIAASTDDAFEGATGTMNVDAASTIGAMTTANQWAGLRFVNVTVPQAAPIALAELGMYSVGTTNDDPVFDLYGEDAGDAATFSTSSGNISGRARTGVKVAVNATGVGVGYYVINVTPIVQAIVNRVDWASGQAMAFILDALSGIAWNFRSWDGNPSEAATLSILHSVGGGSKLTRVRLSTRVGGLLTA